MESIRDLIVDQMKDLYDAEKRLVRAPPKMAKAASNQELKTAFESHLQETRGHVERLEQGFELLGEKAKAKPCVAMKGLIEEGEAGLTPRFGHHLRRSKSGALRDRRLRNLAPVG